MQGRDLLSDDQELNPSGQQSAMLQGRDLLANDPELNPQAAANVPQESFGHALVASPFRLGEDVYKGLFGALKNSPQYYESLKSGIPGAYKTLIKHPGDALRQATAGVAELGQNIFNAPHDVVNYLSERLKLIPEDINKKVQMGRMPDSEEAINASFGAPQGSGEEFIRGLGRNSLNILGAAGLAKSVLSKTPSPRQIADSVVKEGENQTQLHSNMYNQLFNDAEKAGIKEVPVDSDVLQDNLSAIKKYQGPKRYGSLEDFLQDKTPSNAKTAVSDLKKTIRELGDQTSLTGREKKLLGNAEEAKQHIEDHMFIDPSGNLLTNLADRYRAIDQSYKENVIPYKSNKNIQKYKNNKLLPSELVNRLQRGEFAAQKAAAHPDLIPKEKGMLAKYGPWVAGGGVGGAGSYWLTKLLNGNQE